MAKQKPDADVPKGQKTDGRDWPEVNIATQGRARKSIGLLLIVQLSALAVPLATMPFLTRILGPSSWGNLAAIQALAITLSIIVEYGFQYTATRSISLARESRSKVRVIVGDVISAKFILSLASGCVAVVVFFLVPSFRETGYLYLVGVIYSIILGWTPLWYFQGMERLEGAAAIDVVSKILSAVYILAFVRKPSDAILVLGSQAILTALATGWNTLRMIRAVGKPIINFRFASKPLIEGFPMFLYRTVVTIYSAGSTAILRGMSNSIETANYANADRLTTAAKSLVVPVGQVMFPKISRMNADNPAHAKKLMLTSLAGVTIPFGLMAIAGVFLSPWLLPLFFGPDYASTVIIFQILCTTLPLVAASNVLGIQWMLAKGREKAFNGFVIVSALASIIAMLALVPFLGGIGMAWSVIVAEALLVTMMVIHLILSKD